MPTYAWVSPTSTTDEQAVWTNDGNAIDGNWNTFASTGHGPPFTYKRGLELTPYLQFNLSGLMWVDRVRFKYQLLAVDNPILFINIEIWNQNTGVWDTVVDEGQNGTLPYGVQHTILINVTYTNKLRVRAYISGIEIDFYELDVEQVTPDSPNVPPPADPSTIDTTTVQQQSTAVTAVGHGARVRSTRRSTKFVPVIIG